MNNVQAQKEQQVRILGRQIGREISPVETEAVTGGDAQSVSVIYHRATHQTTTDDMGRDA